MTPSARERRDATIPMRVPEAAVRYPELTEWAIRVLRDARERIRQEERE